MINFNADLFSVACSIFEKFEEETRFRPVEPWSDDLWWQLHDSGFTSIGRDAALEDHAALAKAVGRHAVPLPVVEVGLARWVADHAGLDLPEDVVVVCAGLNPDDRIQGRLLDSGDLVLTGHARRVPWARNAGLVVTAVEIGDVTRWVVVPRDRLALAGSVNFASEPRDDLEFEAVEVSADSIGAEAPRTKDVYARGALMRVASAIGAMEFVLDASLMYAEQRHQFGRPISSFQTVQHHLVQIAEAVASVGAAADAAVHCPPGQRLMMVAAAKVMLGEQSATLARLAHQVHGAIGATEEHPIQPRTRRLWSWQDEFGTATDWMVELADQLVFPESPGAWPVMTPPLAALETRDVSETVPW